MEKADTDTFTEFEKRRILSVLSDSRDLMEIASAKIYTNSKEGLSWLYSDIEGFLCYLIDYQEKVQLLILYDFITYEKLFQFELYSEFPNYYSKLTNDFHCFETDNGFVGLKFLNQAEADAFSNRVEKFDSMNQLFKKFLQRRKNKYMIGSHNVTIIKEKFIKDNPSLDKNDSCEVDQNILLEGIEINKPSYYHFLDCITYDSYRRIFRVQDVSPDLKKLFKLSGLKKSDFKNESLALNIFKHLALCYDALQAKKKDKRKLLKNDLNKNQFKSIFEEDLEDIHPLLKKSLSMLEEEKIKETKYRTMKSGLIPVVPKLPAIFKNVENKLKDINVTNVEMNTKSRALSVTKNSNQHSTEKNKPDYSTPNKQEEKHDIKTENCASFMSSETSNSFFEEIRKGVELKKINVAPKEEEKRPLKIHKDDHGFLQSALQKAIQQRREELLNEASDEESDSDSWSD
jgi:hypothetical protein